MMNNAENCSPIPKSQLPITTVIFDMDGLMVDTEPLSRQAWGEVLREYGHRLDDGVYARMIGHRSSDSGQMVLDAYPLPLTLNELILAKNGRYQTILAQGIPEMPGLRALLAELARRHIPWGVATSSPRAHAQAILSRLGLAGACSALATGDEVAHGKPAPDIYRLAAERLGVLPQQCMALEDSAPGCQAAVAAGMRGVAVPNGHTTQADFSFAYAVLPSLQAVATRLDDLLA